MKEIIIKLGFAKIKNFCSVKDIVKRIRKISQRMKKIKNIFIGKSDKGLFCKIHNELLKLNNQKSNNSIKRWSKDLNRDLTKE